MYMRTETLKHIKYIEDQFGTEDTLKKEVRQQLSEDQKEGINISPLEGQILKFLVQLTQANKIIEIGSLYGYSALWFLDGLTEEGHLYCIEKNPLAIGKLKSFLNKSEKKSQVSILEGEAFKSLESIKADGPFDIIFIDANKSAYMEYALWAEENIKKGGLIIGDNTFLFGHVYGEGQFHMSKKCIENMKKFNSYFSQSEKFNAMMLPTPEGLTVAQKLV
jgi:predicted O-methyltransferase YrrM